MQVTDLSAAALVMWHAQCVENELTSMLRRAKHSGDLAAKSRAINQLSEATRYKKQAEQTFSRTQAANDE